jgi:hypothetical protein
VGVPPKDSSLPYTPRSVNGSVLGRALVLGARRASHVLRALDRAAKCEVAAQ